MKKIVAMILAGAMALSSVMAEVRFSGFGRAIPVMVFDNGGDDLEAGRAVSWGGTWGGDYNLGFVVEGRTANCGFFLDIGFMNLPSNDKDYEKNYARLQMYSTADQAKIWAKPFDMLTISAGRVLDKSLRGDLTYGMHTWLRSGAGRLGEGFTFSPWHKIGVEAVLTPIQGLTIFAGIPLDEFSVAGSDVDAKDCYKQVQGGVGYNIADVGLARVQYMGSKEEKKTGAIEAAFDFTMVENLKVTTGIHYTIADDEVVKMKADDVGVINSTENYASLGAEYDYGVGKADLIFRAAWNPNESVGIYAGAGASYNLPASWRIVSDVRFQNERINNDTKVILSHMSIAGLLGVEKELSGGCFGIGFTCATNGEMMGPVQADTSKKDAFIWGIPLKLEYRF